MTAQQHPVISTERADLTGRSGCFGIEPRRLLHRSLTRAAGLRDTAVALIGAVALSGVVPRGALARLRIVVEAEIVEAQVDAVEDLLAHERAGVAKFGEGAQVLFVDAQVTDAVGQVAPGVG